MARDVQQENIYERKTKVIQQFIRVLHQLSTIKNKLAAVAALLFLGDL